MECVTRFSTSIFFMIRTHMGPWWTGYSIFKLSFDLSEIVDRKVRKIRLWCAWHHRVKILGLANQKIVLQIFSFMIDLFTHKRIFPDCLFKSNERLSKMSILTPQCAVWLHGLMQTAEFLFFRYFFSWLCGVMHTAWCPPRSFIKIWIFRRNRNWIRK